MTVDSQGRSYFKCTREFVLREYNKRKVLQPMRRPDWDRYFLNLLEPIAARSLDPDTQIGCVIVGPERNIRATGYNSLARNVEHKEERLVRPEKYKWMEHAERNAIFAAARVGTALAGSMIYTPVLPCIYCALAIIQVGIVETVHDSVKQQRWAQTGSVYTEDFEKIRQMFSEAGVIVRAW